MLSFIRTEPRARRRALRAVAITAAAAGIAAVSITVAPRGSTGAPGRDSSLAPEPGRAFVEELDASRFFKGNLHAHSARSDGDSPADAVFAWYRAHGYQFIALTDHNRVLDPARFKRAERDGFVLLAGEEVTMAAVGEPVHVNALCTATTIGERKFGNRSAALQWAVDSVRAQGGIAMINHPNFSWALDSRLIAPVKGASLIDIYNGHPHVHSDGDETHASSEQMWDELLGRGLRLGPAAVDDAHQFRDEPTDKVAESRPGTGWVMVYAAALERRALCDAIANGRLYASNGPVLSRIAVSGDQLRVWVDEPEAMIEFIGDDGEVLATEAPEADADGSLSAGYRLEGEESYVRARITTAKGRAWTTAYFTRG